MQSRHKASGARGLSGQFSVVLIGCKMSSTRIYSAVQEVPRSECQDVPSEVPKQVEKNVCKDIPRQVRLVNQSIRTAASCLMREGVKLKKGLVFIILRSRPFKTFDLVLTSSLLVK